MKTLVTLCTLGLSLLSFTSTFAQPGPETAAAAAPGAPSSPAALEAKAAVEKYLALVQAKKWKEARKAIHPSTMNAIAERKKRLGREDHPMAPWTFEKKEHYLKDFRITAVEPGAAGAFVVLVSEDNFHVQERGIAEGESAAYLVGKKGGQWFVADKRRGESFTDASIRLGYKGYFDPVPPAAAE